MATFFPKISGNVNTTNGNAKFDLSQHPDNEFDIFKVVEANGIESAYLLFTIKNTATSGDLSVSSISGNAAFNTHFDIDFTESASSLLHLGLDGSANNKLKAIGSIADTNTGVSAANAAANASGASVFFGHGNTQNSNLSININLIGFNFASSARITPVYTTASIIANSIPPISYATFIVKYKPTTSFTEQDFIDNEMKLTILNSHSAQIIKFTGSAVNSLNFNAVIGTGTNSDTDTFLGGSEILTDTGTFHLGYHPIGYKWSSENKTLKLKDNSTTPGSYGFQSFDGSSVDIAYNFNYFQNTPVIDGYDLQANESGIGSLKTKLIESFKHDSEVYTSISNCATNGGTDIANSQVNFGESTTQGDTLFKNFEFSETNEDVNMINYRSSHVDWTVSNPDKDYGEVVEANIKLKTHYYLRDIINITSPGDTLENNRAFIYAITCGFYNKLGMSSDDLLNHASSLGSIMGDNGHNIVLVLNQAVDGPWLQQKSSGAMFRDDVCNFAAYFKYHNFDNNTAEEYKVNTIGIDFSKTEDDSLVLTTNQGGFYHAKYHNTSVTFATGGGAYGNSITTDTDGVTFQGFSENATDGNRLAVKYEVGINNWAMSDMYSNEEGTAFNTVGELPYGAYKTAITPAYPNSNTIWKKGLGSHNMSNITNNLYFFPKYSKLNVISQDEIGLDSLTVFPFTDSEDYTTTSQNLTIKSENITQWYKHESATIVSADVKTKTYATDAGILAQEGDWYGSAGMTLNQPKCWKNNTTRRYTATAGSGVYVDHNAVNRNIKTSSSEFYKEAGEVANFYFKMEDAIYSSSAQLHRAMGVLYFENTGDYTINIQSASIGHKDLSLTGNGDNTNGDLYMSNVNNMLMPESTAGSNFGDGRKPNASNSNEPTWKIAIESDAFSTGPFWGAFAAQQIANGTTNNQVSGKAQVKSTKTTGSTSDILDYYTNDNDGLVELKKATINPTLSIQSQVNYPNRLHIGFELSPTNNSSYDVGSYYTQIMITYYVNDYKNRKSAAVDSAGNITETSASMGPASDDYNTRLHVSKYLVRCNVSSAGVISVVDTENDAAPDTINLPNINIG